MVQNNSSFLNQPDNPILKLEEYLRDNPYLKSITILYEGLPFWSHGTPVKEDTIMRILDALNKLGMAGWIELKLPDSNDTVLARQVDNSFAVICVTSSTTSNILRTMIDDILRGKIPKCKKCGTDLYKATVKCPLCGRTIIAGTDCPYCGYRGIRKCPSCGSSLLPNGDVVTRFDKKTLTVGVIASGIVAAALFLVNPIVSVVAAGSIVFATVMASLRG